MRRFLLFLSKTDYDVLRHCPQNSLNHQLSLGIFVLFTGVFAFISGSYAIAMIFIETGANGKPMPLDNATIILSCCFGFLYSSMIMAIDREIVSSTSKVMWIIRFPLAIMIGFVVATPLELKMMDGKIQSQLHANQIQKNDVARKRHSDSITRRYDDDCEKIKSKIDEGELYILKLEKDMDAEEVGRQVDGRTHKAGRGTSYWQLRDNYNAAYIRQNQYRTELDSLKAQKKVIERIANDAFKRDSIEQTFGLVDRYQALGQIIKNDDTGSTRAMSLFITLLFMIIELVPTFMKLSSTMNEYDAALETRRRMNIQMTHSIGREGMEEMEKNIKNAIEKPSYMKHVWENLMR